MILRGSNEYPAYAWWHAALASPRCPPEVQAIADLAPGGWVKVTRERVQEVLAWAGTLPGWEFPEYGGDYTALVVEEEQP